eukprot:RCo028944
MTACKPRVVGFSPKTFGEVTHQRKNRKIGLCSPFLVYTYSDCFPFTPALSLSQLFFPRFTPLCGCGCFWFLCVCLWVTPSPSSVTSAQRAKDKKRDSVPHHQKRKKE